MKRAERSKTILYNSVGGVFELCSCFSLVYNIIDHENKVKVTKARKVANIRNRYNQVPHLK